MNSKVHIAPPNSGTAELGKTLPGLLWESRARSDNPTFFNDRNGNSWKSISTSDFKSMSSRFALGLLELGISKGDRVALYMESDSQFCVADMGCLIAGVIDVPIYLTHTAEAIEYVLRHADVHAIIVSDSEKLTELVPVLSRLDKLQDVIVFDNHKPTAGIPDNIKVHQASAVMERGRVSEQETPESADDLVAALNPHDTATIIYTSGTTGHPKGVVLTHENISYNGLTSFSGIKKFRMSPDGEVALSFLPLTHVFARTLLYGHIYYGASVYFCGTDEIGERLREVKPTVFATVPRVLEKVYAKILQTGVELSGLKKKIFSFALFAARKYELGTTPSPLLKLRLALAEKLVFTKWRAATGGRVKWVICGGAALNAEITNVFAAARINILQGYGLTETSPVITFNRPDRNRAGTVGQPIPGVEVAIAEDGEIVTRGPHIMVGYYENEEKTSEVIDKDGWFHTGDIGEFTDEGFLKITDRKKDLFKLSTGKYVMPQPLENKLSSHPMIEQAVVFGPSYKYCTALIFPDMSLVRSYAVQEGLPESMSDDDLMKHEVVLHKIQQLIDRANKGMDHWSTIKKFRIVSSSLTPESGLLTPSLKVRRSKVQEHFRDVLDAMYSEDTAANT